MRTRHVIIHICGLAAGVLLAGCEDYPLHDLGYTTQPSSPEPPEQDPGPPVAQHMSELAGVWLGEAEDPFALQSNADLDPPPYRLPSGSSQIWLQIFAPGGDVEATITFGDVEPPAPATNPDLPYPEGASPTVYLADGSPRPPVEGFRYPMYRVLTDRDATVAGVTRGENFEAIGNGALVDGKIDLSFLTSQAFASWCALQTAESCDTSGGYGTDDQGLCYTDASPEPVDCGKVTLCASQVCACEPDYPDYPCSYSLSYPATLVLRRSEEGLVGLFQYGVFVNERGFQQPIGTVHFRRVEPNAAP